MHGDEVPLHFYADLFLKHPETRHLFPVSMQAQRAHLVEALVTIVSGVERCGRARDVPARPRPWSPQVRHAGAAL